MNETAAALVLIVAVFVVAWVWEWGPGILAALLAALCLNYFFLPPLYTFTIADPRNVFALFAFLAAAILIGRLSSLARQRTRLLELERRDLVALSELSEAFLADTNRETLAAVAADRLRRALLCEGVSILVPSEDGRLALVARAGSGNLKEDLAELAFRQGNSAVFPSEQGGDDAYLPIPLGVQRIGALVVLGMRASERLAEACAAMLGIAFERERFLRVIRQAEEARARDELRSTLLAALGHDLKTPVATARAAVENWETESGPTEKGALALDALERLSHVVDGLLSVARLESGSVHPRKERVAPGAIVEAALARFGEALDHHNLFLDVPAAGFDIEVDPAQVAEAVGLALENASRYAPAGTEVRVSAAKEGKRILLRIDDRGPGIPEPERTRAVEKFVRLRGAADKSGSGLGLYIARSLIELNGGVLEISEAPGGGARVEISFEEAS
jgi:two-component system sensor histidine kinase KdpD